MPTCLLSKSDTTTCASNSPKKLYAVTACIILETTELIREEKKKPDVMLEKDLCLKVVEYLRSNKAEFGSGEGEWQCIIGKNLAATLNYDLHMLTFFDLPEFGYSVLVFKSG